MFTLTTSPNAREPASSCRMVGPGNPEVVSPNKASLCESWLSQVLVHSAAKLTDPGRAEHYLKAREYGSRFALISSHSINSLVSWKAQCCDSWDAELQADFQRPLQRNGRVEGPRDWQCYHPASFPTFSRTLYCILAGSGELSGTENSSQLLTSPALRTINGKFCQLKGKKNLPHFTQLWGTIAFSLPGILLGTIQKNSKECYSDPASSVLLSSSDGEESWQPESEKFAHHCEASGQHPWYETLEPQACALSITLELHGLVITDLCGGAAPCIVGYVVAASLAESPPRHWYHSSFSSDNKLFPDSARCPPGDGRHSQQICVYCITRGVLFWVKYFSSAHWPLLSPVKSWEHPFHLHLPGCSSSPNLFSKPNSNFPSSFLNTWWLLSLSPWCRPLPVIISCRPMHQTKQRTFSITCPLFSSIRSNHICCLSFVKFLMYLLRAGVSSCNPHQRGVWCPFFHLKSPSFVPCSGRDVSPVGCVLET